MGPCDDVILDATPTYTYNSGGRRDNTAFFWRVQEVGAAPAFNSALRTHSGPLWQLRAASFAPACAALNVRLRVTTFLGGVADYETTVKRSPEPSPQLQLIMPPTIHGSHSFVVSSRVVLPDMGSMCNGRTWNYSEWHTQFQFHWRVHALVDVDQNGFAPDLMPEWIRTGKARYTNPEQQSAIVIEPHTLSPCSEYIFNLSSTTFFGTFDQLISDARQLKVLPSALHAIVDAQPRVSEASVLELDGSRSYDEARAGPLSYSWDCSVQKTGKPCELIPDEAWLSSTLRIAPGQLLPGVYNFTLAVTADDECMNSQDLRAASDSLLVTITPKALPPVPQIDVQLCDTAGCEQPHYKQHNIYTVNGGSTAYIHFQITQNDWCVAGQVHVQWSGKGAESASMVQPVSRQRWHPLGVHGVEMLRLVLPRTSPSSMRTQAYTFTASAVCENVDGSKDSSRTFAHDVHVQLNAPPKAGVLVVSPTQGDALSTTFKIFHRTSWIDTDLPLRYMFGYSVLEGPAANDGITAGFLHDFPIYSHQFSTTLPEALACESSAVVLVRVLDSLGAQAQCGSDQNAACPPVDVRTYTRNDLSERLQWQVLGLKDGLSSSTNVMDTSSGIALHTRKKNCSTITNDANTPVCAESSCHVPCPSESPSLECSGHGTCLRRPETCVDYATCKLVSAVCICEEGFSGISCSEVDNVRSVIQEENAQLISAVWSAVDALPSTPCDVLTRAVQTLVDITQADLWHVDAESRVDTYTRLNFMLRTHSQCLTEAVVAPLLDILPDFLIQLDLNIASSRRRLASDTSARSAMLQNLASQLQNLTSTLRQANTAVLDNWVSSAVSFMNVCVRLPVTPVTIICHLEQIQ